MSTMSAQQRSAPFSTHSRGVPLFNRGRFFDIPRHVARLLLDLRDISSSAFWFLTCQTWLTLWSALTTLCSVTYFTYGANDYSLAANLDWTLTCFVVVLPLVGFTWVAFGRRERALDELSKVKVLMLSIYSAHRDWAPQDKHSADHLLAVRSAMASLIETMHEYFLAPRFYTRFYPYFGFRGAMVQVALDRARHVRRVGAALAQLSAAACALGAAGLAPALEAQLHDRVMRLHEGLDRLANVKEFRVPQARPPAPPPAAAQGVRSMARFYVCIYIPIFFGPYWAWVSSALGFAFSFFFSILLDIALVAVLNVSLALEDPFDNNGMDGIFVDEALYEVEQLLWGPGGFVPAPGEGAGAWEAEPSSPVAAELRPSLAEPSQQQQGQQQPGQQQAQVQGQGGQQQGQVAGALPLPADTV